MAKFLKNFQNHTQYETYTASTVFITPNVSYCKQEDEVHYSSSSEPPTPPVVHVDSVSVSPATVTLNVGATTALTATVLPADADNKNVVWSSSNPAIATVDANGVVSGIASGDVVITVTTVDGGKTAQCAATIEAQPQPTTAITYTASAQLNVDLTKFTPAATAETFADGVGKIEFANGVTAIEIGSAAFMSNGKLLSIELPNSVTSIGEAAFYQCANLKSIVIPSSVTSIDEYAFYKCTSLTSIDIPDGVTSIGKHVFSICSSLTSITIPNSVTSIGQSAFDGCTSLTSIDIPDSVTSIGAGAFRSCTSLTSIAIPSGVTSIEQGVFSGCTSLTSIDIPSGVKSIGRDAFTYCDSLGSVTMPDSVTSIGESAFQQCNRLASVTCEATTPPSLGGYAFESTNDCPIYVPCESVDAYKAASVWSNYSTRIQCATPPQPTTAITYTASEQLEVDLTAFNPAATGHSFNGSVGNIEFNAPVTEIGEAAFSEKEALTSIVIPDSVTSIGENAFDYCIALTSVTLGNGVTSIGGYAFYECTSLTSCTIGNSVTSIGEAAFGTCTSLTSIDIPSGVTSIGDYAFQRCSGFTSISIPSGVTSIGEYAFVECNGLTSITVNAVTPPTLETGVFDGSTCPIYVPSGSVNTYKTASGWSTYSSRIQAIH